jgi:hypothetical protein
MGGIRRTLDGRKVGQGNSILAPFLPKPRAPLSEATHPAKEHCFMAIQPQLSSGSGKCSLPLSCRLNGGEGSSDGT